MHSFRVTSIHQSYATETANLIRLVSNNDSSSVHSSSFKKKTLCCNHWLQRLRASYLSSAKYLHLKLIMFTQSQMDSGRKNQTYNN